MVEIGKINTLTIKRILDSGAQLEGGDLGDVFLPKKYLSAQSRIGEDVEVFVYEDKEKHLHSTTQKPFATVGDFAKLRVVSLSPSGAYLDWGLQKNLLVPKREQFNEMKEGKSYVVYVFLDEKTNRIAASSKLDKFLSMLPPQYNEGDEVDIIICEKSDLGFKAIVNKSHWGIVYKNEVFQELLIGQKLKGYIKKVREDHKIDLSLHQPGYQQVGEIAQTVLDKLKAFGGRIAVTDKSPPEDIYSLFGVSKKVFKKTIGALYKRRLISIDDEGIRLVKKKG
nr:GntR family transcriptional regulator [Desulfobulbaceae bacterium]